jgi:DNA-directed RNA polymerase specialized sigma subunit
MLTSTSIKPKEVDVMTSGSGDKMSEVVPAMIELDEKINTQITSIIEKQLKAEKVIQQIDNMKYRETLRWYYVQNLRWEEVAQRMNYDISYVQRVNGQALISAAEFMTEEIE